MGNSRRRLGYVGFVIVGLITAFGFEILASPLDPKNATFKNPAWPVFFVIWYGFLYSVSFATLQTRPVWIAAAVWAVVGTVLEIVVFHRLNIIVDRSCTRSCLRFRTRSIGRGVLTESRTVDALRM